MNNNTNNGMQANEALPGQIVDQMTHPCLDPSAASWVGENSRIDMYTLFGDGDLGLELFRDPFWTLGGGGVPNEPMNSMMGDWPVDGPNAGF
jgi:hypothetical protein